MNWKLAKCPCGGKATKTIDTIRGVKMERHECSECHRGTWYSEWSTRQDWPKEKDGDKANWQKAQHSRYDATLDATRTIKAQQKSHRRITKDRRRQLGWLCKNAEYVTMKKVTADLAKVPDTCPWTCKLSGYLVFPVFMPWGRTERMIEGDYARFTVNAPREGYYPSGTMERVQPFSNVETSRSNEWAAKGRRKEEAIQERIRKDSFLARCRAQQLEKAKAKTKTQARQNREYTRQRKAEQRRRATRKVARNDCRQFFAAMAIGGVQG